ncbi:MAG: amidohydrolase family protein [Sciscionella sp.]
MSEGAGRRIGFIDDHAHPFPLAADTLDLGRLTLDVSGGPGTDDRRRAAAPHRLALEAMRVRLGALLCCEPDEIKRVRDARAAEDWPGYVQLLFRDAGVDGMLLDGGSHPLSSDELRRHALLANTPMYQLLRLEAVIDPLLTAGAEADDILEAVERFVADGASAGAVGVKTVLAYRTGLAVNPDVNEEQARRSVTEGGPIRQRAKALRDLITRRTLAQCADLRLPMQIHTGFGDSELRLADADPILLDDVLRTPEGTAAPVVLIHAGYPWHEQIAYLAAIRPRLWAEYSLANLFSPVTTTDRLLRIIDVTPTDRVIFGSDGHGSPETHWFALRVLRAAWRDVRSRLTDMARPGWLDEAGARMFRGNAVELYRLDPDR